MAKTPSTDRLIKRVRDDARISGLFLFGSTARGEPAPRDLDLCLVLKPPFEAEVPGRVRLEYLRESDADIQVFQSLPLQIRRRVLKEGKVLVANDEDALYETARLTIRAWTTGSRSIGAIWRGSGLDGERVLSKLGELDGYIQELQEIVPASFEAYQEVTTRRAVERLLQVGIKCVMDTCAVLVSGLRLGVPSDEEDMISQLQMAGVFSEPMAGTLRSMRGFRNILVHQYGRVDDELVYDSARRGLEDFERFKTEALDFLATKS